MRILVTLVLVCAAFCGLPAQAQTPPSPVDVFVERCQQEVPLDASAYAYALTRTAKNAPTVALADADREFEAVMVEILRRCVGASERWISHSDLVKHEAAIIARYQAMFADLRKAFMANPSAQSFIGGRRLGYDPTPEALEAYNATVRAYRTMEQTCGSFPFDRMPAMNQAAIYAMRTDSDLYEACVLDYRKRRPAALSVDRMETALFHVRAFAPFRCSVRPSPGCVADAGWQAYERVTGTHYIEAARRVAQLDLSRGQKVNEAIDRLNEWDARLDALIARHNARN